jgi:hypothetical protein
MVAAGHYAYTPALCIRLVRWWGRGHAATGRSSRSTSTSPTTLWPLRRPLRLNALSLGDGPRRDAATSLPWRGQSFASFRRIVTIVPSLNGSTTIESINASMIARPSPPSCLAGGSSCHMP